MALIYGNPVQITPVPGGKRELFYIFTNERLPGPVLRRRPDVGPAQQLDGQVTAKNQGRWPTTPARRRGWCRTHNRQSIWLLVYNTANDRRRLRGQTGRPGCSPRRSPRRRACRHATLYKPFIVHSPDYNTLALSNGYY